MEGLHFRYRIGSSKIRQLFKHLKSDKHEIAFHPSRYAFENPDCYLKEKTKIEKISCTKISGLRHHYLRCLFPQIWRTASQLHLKYEAGMIHRRHSGFRAGTCFPFAAFDHKNQKCIDIIEFPITFFENTLPDKGNDFEASKDLIKKLMNVVKKHGGLLNILWHSNNLYQPEVYKKLWNFIINLIKTENAYIQPLIEHYSWHKLRENINIKSFKKSEKGYTIIIALPDGIQQFCLHVPANYKYKSNFKMQHDLIKNILIIDCNNTKTQLSIEALAK